jgi:hypothetical protein
MAEVWLADRVDGAFSRQVAIKLLFRHASSGEVDAFASASREQDILASLRHPHRPARRRCDRMDNRGSRSSTSKASRSRPGAMPGGCRSGPRRGLSSGVDGGATRAQNLSSIATSSLPTFW